MRAGNVLQFEERERRNRKVIAHLVLRVGQRHIGVGMAELHGVGVELRPLVGAERLAGRDLQHDRLRRDLDSGHRDLVVRAEILDRLDIRIAADQRHRLRRGGDDALDAATGAIPQQQEIAGSGIEDVDAAGQQCIGLRAATAQVDPFGGDTGNAEGSRVLLDQLVLFHDVRGHVENARLPRQRDLRLLLGRSLGARQQHQHRNGARAGAPHPVFHCASPPAPR